MNVKIFFLFLGGIWSKEYFDSGQIDLQLTEISSKGSKRVVLEEQLQVHHESTADEEGPVDETEQLDKDIRRKGTFNLPNQRGENRHYNKDRKIKGPKKPKKPKISTNKRNQIKVKPLWLNFSQKRKKTIFYFVKS